MNQQGKNLAEGSVLKQLIVFALPFVLSSIVQNLYSTVDLIILGQFAGTYSLAGANISAQYISTVTNIAIGFCLGGTVIIGQYKGSGNENSLKKVIGTLCAFVALLAVGCTAVSLIFRKGILTLMQTPGEAYSEALVYFTVSAAGFIFIFGYNTLSAILRGMGDSNRPFAFICIACVVNIVLDLALVAGLKMGAFGAAIATIAAQGISMLLCVIYLRGKKFVFDFHLSSFRIYKQELTVLLRTAIPTTIQSTFSVLAFLLITIMVNTLGVTAAAALAGAQKVTLFAILPAIALGNAIAAMCAQNFGADRVDRALLTMKYGFALTMGINLVLFALIELFPAQLMRVFGSDGEMIDLGVQYLRVCSLDYLFVPFMGSVANFLVGSGHTTIPMLLNVGNCVAFRLPSAYILGISMGLGLQGVAWATPIASFGVGLISLIYYLSGRCAKITKVIK